MHCVRGHSVQWGHRLHCAIEGYAAGIVRLIGESYSQLTLQLAWREFNIGQGPQPFYGYDAVTSASARSPRPHSATWS